MRYSILIIFLIAFFSVSNGQRANVEIGESGFLYIKDMQKVDELEYKDIAGHPYSSEELIAGTITFTSGNKINNMPMRYNWHTNNMEFKPEDQILIMPNSSEIDFVEVNNERYIPFFYLKEINGFLIELYRGEYSIFRKDEVEFISATPPSTGYDASHPAQFKRTKPTYYVISSEGKLIELEQNKKKLPSQFEKPESNILATLISEYKLNPKKEADLIKLITLFDNSDSVAPELN